jgi:2-(1,2-epoxy-1,2-dihydrophenyl)acetyl-CoA isomerase
MGMIKFLPELVGPQRAKEMLFLGGKISSEKMYELGLVNRVFPAKSLETDTFVFARELAAMPETSIQITKGMINSLTDWNLNALFEAESTASPFCTTTRAYAKTVERFTR